MAVPSPARLFAIRLRIAQPKAAPFHLGQDETFHFDSAPAREDFLKLCKDGGIVFVELGRWEANVPTRSLPDSAFERAKIISEQDL